MRTTLLVVAALLALALLPSSASAAVCADYATQADAQAAADTRDSDGDGRYCESLPCPCASGSASATPSPPAPPPRASRPRGCSRPSTVQRLRFSKLKYPNIKAHTDAAIARGWPRIMVVNRKGAEQRRERPSFRGPGVRSNRLSLPAGDLRRPLSRQENDSHASLASEPGRSSPAAKHPQTPGWKGHPGASDAAAPRRD